MDDYPLKTLHDSIEKYGLRQHYEIIETKKAKSHEKFSVRLICPITRDGPLLIVKSSGASKRDAKCDAARRFIYKYLIITEDDSASIPLEFITLTNNIPLSHRIIVLEIICSTIVFAKPVYVELGVMGTLQSPCFISEYRISYLRSGGRGESRAAAQSDAAMKMIQRLMDVESIYQMIKGQYSSPVNTTDDARAVSSKDSSRDSPTALICKEETTVDTNKSLSSRLLRARSTEVSLNSVRIRKKPRNFINTENTEAGNGESVDGQLIGKANSTCSNVVTLNNVDDTVLGSNSKGNCRPLTRLQLNSRIERIDKLAEGYEKQLYDLVLEVVMCGSQSLEKSISILSEEYNVILNRFSPPKIFQGGHECEDKSIRIACLMKTLIKFKEDMEYDFNKSDSEKH